MDKILQASYGDPEQRQRNQRQPDPELAARLYSEFKQRRGAPGVVQNYANDYRKARPNDPPFWDYRVHGTVQGPVQGPVRPAGGDIAGADKVEIRPGVYHYVVQNKPGRAGVRARSASPGVRRGVSARSPGKSRPDQQEPEIGKHGQQQVPGTVLAKLEELMREQLRKRAAMHVTEKNVLLRLFAQVLGKRGAELRAEDKVTQEQFMTAWQVLGVSVNPALADALFAKYGRDRQGKLPVMVFTDALLVGGPRLMMMAHDVQKGAFQPGRPALHMGKIIYPQCKSGVWPPSDWDPQLAERSNELPDVRLRLEFVYGYDCVNATSPNLFFTDQAEVVFHSAAVCVVYNKQHHTQRLFLGHDDDINCVALGPDRRLAASGQIGADPPAIVWDTTTMEERARLYHGHGARGIQCVCFSPDGRMLVTVQLDNSHTLTIWDWERGARMMERKGQAGTPPCIFDVMWSSYEPNRLVTYGTKHIKFWTLISRAPQLQQGGKARAQPARPPAQAAVTEFDCQVSSGSFGAVKTHTVTGACFLPSGTVLSGSVQGSIVVWKNSRATRELAAHAPGSLYKRPDGSQTYSGVRCLVLSEDHRTMLSGGGDGRVLRWDVSKGDLGGVLQQWSLMRPDQLAGGVAAPPLRALDCLRGSDVFIAGTGHSDIWLVGGSTPPEVLMWGQQGDLYGLAVNPTFPHIFATASDSETVTLWNAVTRKVVKVVGQGIKASTLAFSPDGNKLALGLRNGAVRVMEFYPEVAQVGWVKTLDTAVEDLKYSPDGRYLAAGSHEHVIDVYDVRGGYKRIARCSGHGSTITHLDWSLDSRTIMSNSTSYEILHHDARSGQQLTSDQRDTQWHSWTCTLGFPVMGMWPPVSDGTDINACHRSHNEQYLITSDDFGKVKLFNWPCVVEHAPAQVYCGHSSHVMCVRWAADDSYAVSVGGRDRSIFQWRVVQPVVPAKYEVVAPYAPFQQMDAQGVMWRAPEAPMPAVQREAPPPGQQAMRRVTAWK